MTKKNILTIYQKVLSQNEKIYNFKSTPITLLIISKISYFFSLYLILLRINPNKITYLNFLISIISIFFIFFSSIENDFIIYGISLYFLCLIIDFCDGTVARYFKITSFYGKFIDGLVDIWTGLGHAPDGPETKTCPAKKPSNTDTRIDYCFTTTDLAEKAVSMRVDQSAQGSDHQPITIEFKA